MDKKGIFIVIEGTDGSGKGTQFKLITDKLEAAGHDVETFDFPQYDQPSSYFVKRYLNGDYGTAEDVGPYTSSLFYALDRFEAAPRIRQALKDGKVVISNRFTGSSMAHQGTKIANAEQRRGFFIWLDNLEFEMLRIPRPDISFVLRVPADIAQKLVDQKAERSYTDKKRDLHEADLAHLERSVAVYDDLTQLFPKDFQRIDCVRSGKLLDIDTVQAMLWEKVSPLLPAPTGKKPQPKALAAKAGPAATPDASHKAEASPEPKTEHITLNNVSSLTVCKIERLTPDAVITYPDIPNIYTPANLVPPAAKEYEAKTNVMLGLYAKLVAGLARHGISTPEARQAARGALPVAAAAEVRIALNTPNLEKLIIELINDPLPEAQTAGAEIFAQTIAADPSRFKGASTPVKRATPTAVRAIAEEFLSQNHIGEQPPAQLTAVWPRNENDLIADMLYPHTGLPLRTIQDRIASWPMNRKLEVVESYLSDTQPGPALERAHYSWDLSTPFSVFRELQRAPSEALEIQTLTARHGYDIPEIIDEAGLADTYQKCFDLSLELYSILQQAGHHTEGQYATLHGHNQRWKITVNLSQFNKLTTIAGPLAQQTIDYMHDHLAEIHPTLGESIKTRR